MFLTELPIIQILSVILFSLVIFGLIGSLDYFTPHFIKSHLSRGYKKTSDSVTDKEILLLIQNQKSGYLSPKELSKNFEISLKDANVRLKYLEYLKTISSKENKYSNTHFYYLNDSISKAPYPTLSEKPFITTSD
ncbi:MAG: hypothetical protein KJN84_04755, partial [Bacteroidia bacterium]|nr:hypothetical protein [Bacteroidia bacterium]